MAIYALEDRILFDAAGPGDSDPAADSAADANKAPIESEPTPEKQSETEKQDSADNTAPASESEKRSEEENKETSSKDTPSQESGEEDKSSSNSDSESTEESSPSTPEESNETSDEQESAAETEPSGSDPQTDDEQLTVEEPEEEKEEPIAFVSDSLADKEAIIEALEEEEVEVVVVGSTDSGLEVISSTLEGREDVGAIHIFSHGGDGHFVLGSDVVDSSTLEKNTELVQNWASALAQDGDINLYGCKIAESDTGKAFINKLAKLTRADVAASTDDTGSSSIGADWELEYSNGITSSLALDTVQTVSALETIVVDTLADENDHSIIDGDVSLRDAVEQAADGDIIIFAYQLDDGTGTGDLVTQGTIDISSLGEIIINKSLTINGDNRITIDGDGLSRIFNIDDTTGGGDDTTFIDVALSGLTLKNGNAGLGGAIYNLENLTISNTAIYDNTASGATGSGGGIFATLGTTEIANSTISGNDAVYGGGVFVSAGSLTISGSTISGNDATSYGGGLYMGVIGNVGTTSTISNSTIAGNTAGDEGGGIRTYYGTTTISSTIIGNNSAGTSGDDFYNFGSILNVSSSLIETTNGNHGIVDGTDNNIVGIDPLIKDLTDNGGPTMTHSLMAGSPALNHGTDNGLTSDQRGQARDDGSGVDIGAYEDQDPKDYLEVDSLVDESDGDYSYGDFSLREAIELAASPHTPDTINFAAELNDADDSNPKNFVDPTSNPINLTAELGISSDLTINGDNRLTIDGQNASRIFNVDDITAGGDDTTFINVTLNGLTLQNGNVAGSGGAIYSLENLTISNSTISSNTASGSGGGIFGIRGTTEITNSTISGNDAFLGGGVFVSAGSLTISGSTISGNDATSYGGGLYMGVIGAAGTTSTISNSTIAGNTAGDEGGGIRSYYGTTTISSTIIGNNSAGGVGDDFYNFGSILDVSYSLIETTNGNHGLVDGTDNNIVGIDPLIKDLADNGGPTMTHALMAGSPALNRGFHPAPAGQFDQRGAGYDRDDGNGVDIGAYEDQNPSDYLEVDNLVDESDNDYSHGDLSLREAIELAKSPYMPDAIQFAANLNEAPDSAANKNFIGGTGTIYMTQAATEPWGGDFNINESLTINGHNRITIDARPDNNVGTVSANRIFNIDDTTAGGSDTTIIDVTLDGLILKNGNVTGSGGAVFSKENLSINNCTIIDNTATNHGAGVFLEVFSNSATTINDSLISDNIITGFGHGGGVSAFVRGGILSIENSTISNNTIAERLHGGGGIHAYLNYGSFSINNSTISGNSITGTDGGGGSGISIMTLNGTASIENSTISGNFTTGTQSSGGGIYARTSYGTINIKNSTLSNNYTTGDQSRGGGIYIQNNSGTATVSNSTISGNYTSGDNSYGGGLFAYSRPNTQTTIGNSTIVNNSTTGANAFGGGVAAIAYTYTTSITSSIIANNSANAPGNDLADLFLGSLSVEYSLIETTDGHLVDNDQVTGTGSFDRNNITGIDPLLENLANNGGPTMTHALLAGSPALNNGIANGLANDQRGAGYLRDDGSGVDIGAFEDQNPVLNLEVDYLVDEFDNDYSDGDLSLREAIELAKSPYIADTINFASNLTSGSIIHMTQYDATTAPWGGEFLIDQSLTINGDGRITIDGGYDSIDPLSGTRIFNIGDFDPSPGASFYVGLNGLILQNGNAGSFSGGAVFNREILVIRDSTISGNHAVRGGGVYSWTDYYGHNRTSIIDSTISGNIASDDGGGVFVRSDQHGSTVTKIINSTISGNTACDDGGGVYTRDYSNDDYTYTTIVNSTISGNIASGDGGGVFASINSSDPTRMEIFNSTISGNSSYTGGGLAIATSGGTTTISSTIIGNNSVTAGGSSPDLFHQAGAGAFNVEYSLIETSDGHSIVNGTNIIGLDPFLESLADNGGPTQTHALLAGSPALHHGAANGLTTDQRGTGYSRDDGSGVDIGAYEDQYPRDYLEVDNLVDEFDTDYGDGDLSLREAIELAKSPYIPDTIEFAFSLNNAPDTAANKNWVSSPGDTIIYMTQAATEPTWGGDFIINQNLTIDGDERITIDGRPWDYVNGIIGGLAANRIFNINDVSAAHPTGDDTTNINVTLDGLTLQYGNVTGSGGAIYSLESLNLSNSTIKTNVADTFGGGISLSGDNGAAISISNSTISGNIADDRGGGIYTTVDGNATVTISNSTISGNTAGTLYGGGIFVITHEYSTTLISNSTICNNHANDYGGGVFIYHSTGTTTISSSIIANNTAVSNAADLELYGNDAGVTVENSLVETDDSGHSLVHGDNGNIIGVDPLLGVLADNGGPTWTHALLAGSPALNTGTNPQNLQNDQRGSGFSRDVDGTDMGAYERQPFTKRDVDTLEDINDGDFSAGDYSLREAIANADPGDTINFADSIYSPSTGTWVTEGTIHMTPYSAATAPWGGEFVVDISLTIDGGNRITIDARPDASTPAINRIININDGTTTDIDVTLNGLTLQNGNVTGSGGAVYSRENLSITNTTIADSTASISGGGIFGTNGIITIENSTLSGNSALAHSGGGIFAAPGNSNTATILNSTISGNTTMLYGGGVYIKTGTGNTATILNSTIAGNDSNDYGGGVFIHNQYGGTTTIDSTIIANNSATGNGADLEIYGPDATVTVENSLIETDDFGHSLVDGNNGNIIGHDPNLGPLANNGGPTMTHALLAGSRALNAGANPQNLSHDQRGGPWARDDGNGVDMGSYEVQAAPTSLEVDTLVDELDSDFSHGDFSLREALELASSLGTVTTISFADQLTNTSGIWVDSGTIQMTGSGTAPWGGEFTVDQSLVIDGENRITIDGQHQSRIFNIYNATVDTDVTITGLTLENGNTSGDGGAIFNTENLVVDNVTFSDNYANRGGALFSLAGTGVTTTIRDSSFSSDRASRGGSLFLHADGGLNELIDSTVSNSSTWQHGGGIYAHAENGGRNIIDSVTVTDNEAYSSGGGIYVFADDPVSENIITNSTISGNWSDDEGGGISAQSTNGGSNNIDSSTVADNLARDEGGGIHLFADNANSENIVQNSTITNNTADEGGGVYAHGYDDSQNSIINSTISGNNADEEGGGLYLRARLGADNSISNATITDNSSGRGGGVFAYADGASVNTITSTIIGNNSSRWWTNSGQDLYASSRLDVSYSLIETTDGHSVDNNPLTGSGADVDEYNIIDIDPQLGPLADNGGPTMTHMLLAASPAVGAGFADPGLLNDQRGNGYPRNAGGVDIGAVEGVARLVDNLIDESDGDYTAGDYSLREAIEQAAPGDIINFANLLNIAEDGLDKSWVTHGTINMRFGEFTIDHNLTIDGGGRVVIDGQGASRIFNIDDGDNNVNSEVHLNSLTLTGGNAINNSGGAVYSRESLSISNSVITANHADLYGGGIYSNFSDDGTFTVTNSTISGNTATFGGGLYVSNRNGTVAIDNSIVTENTAGILPAWDSFGGGMFVWTFRGLTTITNSTISDNTTNGVHYSYGAGIYAVTEYGSTIISNSTISNNTVSECFYGFGAGVFARTTQESTVSLSGSVVSGNRVNGYAALGGGIFSTTRLRSSMTISNSDISGNISTDLDYGRSRSEGGGILSWVSDGSTSTITDSSISGNSVGDKGGGILLGASGGETEVSNSTISGNSADYGGGIYTRSYGGSTRISSSSITGNNAASGGGGVFVKNSITSISDSTISDNSVVEGFGGGLAAFIKFGSATVSNSTISNNQANGVPTLNNYNGIGGGAALFTYSYNSATISNSTIAGNTATYGGGVATTHIDLFPGGGQTSSTTITSTIIADNSATTLGNDLFDASQTLNVNYSLIETTDGHNVDNNPATGNGEDNNNIVDVDPMLDVLADNGGPTLTHALLAGSPAIGAGFADAELLNDQRGAGYPRNVNGVDIGAVECVAHVVDNLVDEFDTNYGYGDYSLREAIDQAGDGDKIIFAAQLNINPDALGTKTFVPSGTIAMTANDATNPWGGQFIINKSLIIDGENRITVDAQGNSRIFNISDNDPLVHRTVKLSGMTLINGDATYGYGGFYGAGGAILNTENLTVNHCTISSNTALAGGGIFTYGYSGTATTIQNSTVSNNLAYYSGGGIFAIAYQNSSTTISNSNISGNTVNSKNLLVFPAKRVRPYWGGLYYGMRYRSFYGTGGGIFLSAVENSETNITNSTITNNSVLAGYHYYGYGRYWSSASGGGIFSYTRDGSTSRITDSTISGNRSVCYYSGHTTGGGIVAIADSGGSNIITNSTISNNQAVGQNVDPTSYHGIRSVGGGIAAWSHGGGSNTISESTISGNSAIGHQGSGYYYYYRYFSSGNSTGGGVYLGAQQRGTNRISNSTISGNTAHMVANDSSYMGYRYYRYSGSSSGGGVSAVAINGSNTIINSTISGNAATDEHTAGRLRFTTLSYGGGMSVTAYSGGTNMIANSTIAANHAGVVGGGISQVLWNSRGWYYWYGYNSPGTTTVTSSIIADNSATYYANDLFDFWRLNNTNVTNSLIEDPAGHYVVDGVDGNIVSARIPYSVPLPITAVPPEPMHLVLAALP